MRYFNLQLLEGDDPQSAVVKHSINGILPDSFNEMPEGFLKEIYAFPAFRQLQLAEKCLSMNHRVVNGHDIYETNFSNS